MAGVLTREQVEDFLYHEAELLDDWKLDEWAKLYRDDSLYEVTSPSSTDPLNSDPNTALFLVADKIDRIRGRAARLMKKTAHAEYPHSKTRHLITNIRSRAGDAGQTRVRANFVVYRTKEVTTTAYMGEYHYRLLLTDDGVRVLQKRIILDLNSLYDQGRLTIIL